MLLTFRDVIKWLEHVVNNLSDVQRDQFFCVIEIIAQVNGLIKLWKYKGLKHSHNLESRKTPNIRQTGLDVNTKSAP